MPESAKTHIFITGATGYIGGSVLSALLSHPRAKSFQITALTRSPDKVALLNSVGVIAVVGSNQDLEKLTELARDSDVAIACADADDLQAAKAILLGLKQRYDKTDKLPILIHTSGTGVFIDDAAGNHITDKIYSDLDIPMIESLPKTQPHREVDIEVVAADKKGYVRTYIILPSTIYGIANTSMVKLGIQNPYSKQIPALIKASIDRKQGGVVGKGLNLWPNIHINDTATLYTTVFDAAMKGSGEAGHGREGFYIGANGEHRVGRISEIIAQLLYEMKLGKSPEPTVFTEEELRKYFGGPYIGSNSRVRAERAKLVGWNPVHTVDSLWASLKPETEAIAEMQNI
ncbi:NAD(P)-binding protein [Suillus brevipes Sb2]|nr:NAD(P)-binding protein [Suillus brevipes Sb2]